MKTNSVLLVALLTLAGLGAGMIIGGRLSSPRNPVAASAPASGTGEVQQLPAVTPARPADSAIATAPPPPSAAPADVVAELQRAIRARSGRSRRALNDLVQKLNPADLPRLLALVEQWPSMNDRNQLRPLLLARWAEIDVTAAMASANTVTGTQNRQQAVGAVLRAWAEKDADAAAAWAQQLPAGVLRKQALANVSYELARKNPQAAYALLMASEPGERRWGMVNETMELQCSV